MDSVQRHVFKLILLRRRILLMLKQHLLQPRSSYSVSLWLTMPSTAESPLFNRMVLVASLEQ